MYLKVAQETRIRCLWICMIIGSTWKKTGQWRYPTPTYFVAALDLAIAEHRDGRGVTGPGALYADNRDLAFPRRCGFWFLDLLRLDQVQGLYYLSRQDHCGRDFPCWLHRAGLFEELG